METKREERERGSMKEEGRRGEWKGMERRDYENERGDYGMEFEGSLLQIRTLTMQIDEN